MPRAHLAHAAYLGVWLGQTSPRPLPKDDHFPAGYGVLRRTRRHGGTSGRRYAASASWLSRVATARSSTERTHCALVITWFHENRSTSQPSTTSSS